MLQISVDRKASASMTSYHSSPRIRIPNTSRQVIHEGTFEEATATLQVWGAALQSIQQQGVDANINTQVPDFIAGFFEKAVESGYGEENVMALVKVLKTDSEH